MLDIESIKIKTLEMITEIKRMSPKCDICLKASNCFSDIMSRYCNIRHLFNKLRVKEITKNKVKKEALYTKLRIKAGTHSNIKKFSKFKYKNSNVNIYSNGNVTTLSQKEVMKQYNIPDKKELYDLCHFRNKYHNVYFNFVGASVGTNYDLYDLEFNLVKKNINSMEATSILLLYNRYYITQAEKKSCSYNGYYFVRAGQPLKIRKPKKEN